METKKVQAILDDEKFWPFWVALLEEIHNSETQKNPTYLSKLSNVFYQKRLKTQQAIRKWLWELVNRGLIREHKVGKVIFFKLTPLGKETANQFALMKQNLGSYNGPTKTKDKRK